MEFHLLPAFRGDPPIPVPRTPYLARERYDGGPWLSYPNRKGRHITGWDGTSLDQMAYNRSLWVNPRPTAEEESFLQTWLYFGLICEFTCANTSNSEGESSPLDASSKETIDRLYKAVLVEEGDRTYVRLDTDCLGLFLEVGRSRMPTDPEVRKTRYQHLTLCLSYAQAVLFGASKDFNHSVRFSIAALGELFTTTANFGLQRLNVPTTFGRIWSTGFLTDEDKSSMRTHGWCPSDIARAEAKYLSIQSLFLVRMLDKSLPRRDHSQCTDSSCNLYQINMGEYEARHQHEGCSCEQLEVDSDHLSEILRKDNCYPLLRLEGDLHNLRAELVEFSDQTPYVAISHVWADGLGNPNANSLHRCKLLHLRELVSGVTESDPEKTWKASETPLIWLDTLCCPAQDGEGKQTAIEKIRLVYRQAKHVLVLDAGLMSYSAFTQEVPEFLARVFTSSWMRRLWTLQEGALAKSLYFQSADKALSLGDLGGSIIKLGSSSMRHKSILMDFVKEFMSIQSFFLNPPTTLVPLSQLDQSLHFRSVSVATDEPLCIGTLMNLDLHAILAVTPKDDRMQKVWELIANKRGGLPARIIFFEEPKIPVKGWRWAPQSLLKVMKGLQGTNVRIIRWDESQLGTVNPKNRKGLRVQYPGYIIKCKDYTVLDDRPQNPWPGAFRIPESYIFFRNVDTGEWNRVTDKRLAYLNQQWKTEDDRHEYNKKELFPLNDIAKTDKSVIILNSQEGVQEGIFGILASPEDETTSSTIIQAGPENETLKLATHDTNLAPSMQAVKLDADASYKAIPAPTSELERLQAQWKDGIAVETKMHIMAKPLSPEEAYMYDTLSRLALELRASELTSQHLQLHAQLERTCYIFSMDLGDRMKGDEIFKASWRGLSDRMKEMVREVVRRDERFVRSVETFYGKSFLETIWVLIRDWFYHCYEGRRVREEQVWFVD